MDINTHLEQLANQLDREDEIICANSVESLLASNSLVKTAQYVGVIGYVLKQNRAMCNCIRKKRVASEGSMQDVILECLKEYQDGQDYHDTNWTSKYAQVISEAPDAFDTAHLSFLYNLGGEFSEHIDKVRHTAQVLRNNKKDDELISKILSHAEQLGQILKKEASTRPFRLAASPGGFSRFWDYLRGRGGEKTDEQTMDKEVDQITSQIVEVANITSGVKSAIRRLKRDTHQHLKERRMSLGGRTISMKDEEGKVYNLIQNFLDPDNWNKSIAHINQTRIDTTKLPNKDIYDRAIELGAKITEGSQLIDTTLDNIRQTMFSLRKRGALLSNTTQSYAGHSQEILKTYQQLAQAVDRLEEDPLDDESQRFAQGAANRLNAILDPNQLEDTDVYNTGFDKWIKGDQATPDPVGSADPAAPATPDPAAPTSPEVDMTKAPEIAASIKQNIKDPAELEIAESVLAGISGAINRSEMSFIVPLITAVRGYLRPAPATSVAAPVPVAVPVADPVASPANTSEENDIPEPGILSDDPMSSAFDKPKFASIQDCLVKIGDAVDQVDPQLADIIDNFVEEQGHFLLPELPEFGVLLKEKEDEG